MRNIIEYNGFKWVDVTGPDNNDIEYLKNDLGLNPIALRNVFPSILHPDFEIFPDYISIIVHYPRNEETGNVEIHELDIIAGKNYLITNHFTPIKPLTYIIEECLSSEGLKKDYMQGGPGILLFFVLNKFLRRILEKTDKIGEEVSSAEREIFTEQEEAMVKKISYLKRKIISFWRAVNPQAEVFYYLKTSGIKFFGQELQYRFSDLFRINQRIENSMKTYKETIASLEETNHSMVNLRRNDIMKILTLVSVIFMPLTLIASMWGMNTTLLPFRQFDSDFIIIMGLMAVITIGMLSYFKFKKWL
jgi:magnesium transporter